MTIEERAAAAAELKATGKCNCAQAVLKVFEDKLPVDDETLMKLSAGYTAGMGCMESSCGALIGAVMVAGALTNGKGTSRTAKAIIQGGGLLRMYGIAPFGPKYRCIVFWPKAYNLSQYRTDLAILKFAHSHLPFGFGRL